MISPATPPRHITPQSTTSIQAAVSRYCRHTLHGSSRARRELIRFVSGIVSDYDRTWQIYLGNATNEYINTDAAHDQCDIKQLVSLERRLRWQKFVTRLGLSADGLRQVLDDCLTTFGDRYLCFLARRIADAMAELFDSAAAF